MTDRFWVKFLVCATFVVAVEFAGIFAVQWLGLAGEVGRGGALLVVAAAIILVALAFAAVAALEDGFDLDESKEFGNY